MLNISKRYNRYLQNKKRKELKRSIKLLEEYYTKNNKWVASLEVNIELLKLLKAEMLLVSASDPKSIYLNTGFANVTHLFNWTGIIIETLKNRETVTFDMVNLTYQRKDINLHNFLLTNDGRTYPIESLYINLTSELSTILHIFDDIKDVRYSDHSSAALNGVWVDIFSIVEMLCNLGVAENE